MTAGRKVDRDDRTDYWKLDISSMVAVQGKEETHLQRLALSGASEGRVRLAELRAREHLLTTTTCGGH